MKKRKNMLKALLLLAVGYVISSCDKNTNPHYEAGTTIPVEVGVDVKSLFTRSFSDNGFHNVNRILVLPFKKINEGGANDNSNFAPSYTLAVQKDVSLSTGNDAQVVLHLPVNTTHKVLVIGYNQADYNYNDRTNPANMFDIGSTALPTTLDNFHIYPKSPARVPEFFTAICKVYNVSTLIGDTFSSEQRYTVSGELQRLVSGLSISLAGIPSYVKSISLVAENLTKASKAVGGAIVLSQTTGDGGIRIIRKKTPDSSGNLTFDEYLLPTFDSHKTGFYLDVEYGTTTERFEVKVNDSANAISGNKFILLPNSAINLTGNYSSINFGFELSLVINLDDDFWDGWN